MAFLTQKSFQETASDITRDEYIRERISPAYRDLLYLHLSDLLDFIRPLSRENYNRVLDFGCGGSPYRTLFTCNQYIRADYVRSTGLDLLIDEGGLLPIPDGSCDCVLSTQVLEHVRDPIRYLSEAHRVLRPGGALILTTHGIWEDHGCPYDFWRWTRDGLCLEVERAGFTVHKSARLTTGDRARLFLFAPALDAITESRRSLLGLALWLLRKSIWGRVESRNQWADLRYQRQKMIVDGSCDEKLYLALGIHAIKR